MYRKRLCYVAVIASFALSAGRTHGQVLIGRGNPVELSGPILNSGASNVGWTFTDAGPSATYPNAPGVAGGTPVGTTGQRGYGWSILEAPIMTFGPAHIHTTGNFIWDATPADPFKFDFETRSPTSLTSDNNQVLAPMEDFDPTLRYSWVVLSWEGQYLTKNLAAYPNGPPTDPAMLKASTIFDTSRDLNPSDDGPMTSRNFSWSLDVPDKTLSLIYTPMPEPGSFVLVAVAAGGWFARRRLSRRVSPN
jgi:hypothetical protein